MKDYLTDLSAPTLKAITADKTWRKERERQEDNETENKQTGRKM